MCMKKTLVKCKVSAIERESKFHTTLLESITKFSMMSLGTRDMQASSTKVNEENDDANMKLS